MKHGGLIYGGIISQGTYIYYRNRVLFVLFLGLMSNVSIPMLAIRSVVITIIVGILSSLFVKYIVSVTKTVSPDGIGQTQKSVPPKIDKPRLHEGKTMGQNNK